MNEGLRQPPPVHGLVLSCGVPPDAHVNDALPLSENMVNSIQALTPHAGLQVQFRF